MNEPKLRFPEFKDLWNDHKIEDMFDRVGTPVDLDDTQTYREIGIRSHGKGIFHKDETTASEIGNKRVFWAEPNCFVVNIVFAWERAVAKTTGDENGMIASHRFPMYKPKKNIVDLDYITEYFITKRGQNVLILASPGGAGRNKTLGQKEFAKSVVKLPSPPEQQKIANFLSTIDTVIAKQKETVSAWEERKKGVMQKLFSQEIRFKSDDGSEFPEWKEKTFHEVIKLYRGSSPRPIVEYIVDDNQGLNWIKISDVPQNGNVITTVKEHISKEGAEKSRAVYKGEIILSNSMSFGKPCILGIDGFIHDGWFVIREYEKYLNKWYLCQLLNSDIMYKQYRRLAAGGVVLNISSEIVNSTKIPVPCLSEQQKIADCLSSLDEVIEKQKATLSAWEELKKGLLQQMFV